MKHPVDFHNHDVALLCQQFGARRLDLFGSAQYAEAYFSLKEGLESLFDRSVDLVTGKLL